LELAVERAEGRRPRRGVTARDRTTFSRGGEHEVVRGPGTGQVRQLRRTQLGAKVETLIAARSRLDAEHRELHRRSLEIQRRSGLVPAPDAKWSRSGRPCPANGAGGPDLQLRPAPLIEGDRQRGVASRGRQPSNELGCDAVEEARAEDDL